MLLVRPGRLSDLDPLERMARTACPVLHSLPHDRETLRERIAMSEDAFGTEVEVPGEEIYLFVLEDTSRGAVVGTSTIVAAAGCAEPFYAFRNDALIHASRELHVSRKIHALTMSHELTGRSRLAGFHIEPALLGDPVAHVLSRARMMYVASHRQRFSSDVFSLLLGVTDDAGVSPFWEAVGRKFFQRDFADVERVSGGRSRTFIAEVMPVYPLYVPLLPPAAQRVLGEPGPNALRSYEIHLDEGFQPDRYVDIFDAGPVLTVQVDACACVTRAQRREVTDFDGSAATRHAPPHVPFQVPFQVPSQVSSQISSQVPLQMPLQTPLQMPRYAPHMVSTDASGEFRCVLADLPVDRSEGAPLDARTREALGVTSAAHVRCVPLGREGERA